MRKTKLNRLFYNCVNLLDQCFLKHEDGGPIDPPPLLLKKKLPTKNRALLALKDIKNNFED